MLYKQLAIIILAAGKGKRMLSDRAKVLHEIRCKPMIWYVINSAMKISNELIVVIGHQAEQVRSYINSVFSGIGFAHQKEQLGTGHAVLCAIEHISEEAKDVLILCGDVPFISIDSIKRLIEVHYNGKNMVTLFGLDIDNPTGYGRIIFNSKGNVIDIVEEVDALPDQKRLTIVNSGVYCVNKEFLLEAVKNIKDENAQKEFYLTDIVKIAAKHKNDIGFLLAEDMNELRGVNTLDQLKEIECLCKY